ncbi:MAG TPA: PH domain-containing protein [Galbitalea sp.]|jgi:uncharacterized membrane protein YdbT with pleckstrin-like domain|nr:PH domain-containing protein [Galbitalea sp.]
MSGEVQPVEVIVARLRQHGRALFWPCFVLVAVAFASGYAYGRFPESWENLAVLAAGVLLVVLLWLFPVVVWLSRNYTITSRRVILRSGVLVRVRQEVLHSRSFDVTVRKSGLQGLVGSGDVEINAGPDRMVVLRDVPSANLVQAALHDLIESSGPSGPSRASGTGAAASDETIIWGTR